MKILFICRFNIDNLILTSSLDTTVKVFSLQNAKTERLFDFKFDRSDNNITKLIKINSNSFLAHDESSPLVF